MKLIYALCRGNRSRSEVDGVVRWLTSTVPSGSSKRSKNFPPLCVTASGPSRGLLRTSARAQVQHRCGSSRLFGAHGSLDRIMVPRRSDPATDRRLQLSDGGRCVAAMQMHSSSRQRPMAFGRGTGDREGERWPSLGVQIALTTILLHTKWPAISVAAADLTGCTTDVPSPAFGRGTNRWPSPAKFNHPLT